MISIGRGSTVMYFGQGLILSSLEAESLTYSGDYPARDLWERSPKPRRLIIEGYIAATAEDPKDHRRELTLTRNILSRITSPDGVFFVKIDDKIAYLTGGELVFKRSAPFSGKSAERFTLTAIIEDGYFKNPPVTVHVAEETEGFHYPLTGDLTAGVMTGHSVIRLRNGGDIPVGFTAELSPRSTVTSFSVKCEESGKSITVKRSFGSGDVIRLSTHRDSLYFEVIRGGVSYDLTGRAESSSELFLLPCGDCTIRVGNGDPFEGSLTYTEAFVSF